MLVLTRKVGESLRIGSDVRVTVVSIDRGHARIAIEAPGEVVVHREEVYQRIVRANVDSARSSGVATEGLPTEITRLARAVSPRHGRGGSSDG